jgi:hypothetical protein
MDGCRHQRRDAGACTRAAVHGIESSNGDGSSKKAPCISTDGGIPNIWLKVRVRCAALIGFVARDAAFLAGRIAERRRRR